MAVKGKTNNPHGRPAGKPNKATQAAREAIALFVDNNTHRLQGWLDAIAQENPEKAFNLFQSVIEYHVPKLARQEIANPAGEVFKTQSLSDSDKEIINRAITNLKEPK